MGYTHYWERLEVLPRPQFVAAVEDCRRLCEALHIPLGDAEGNGNPTFTDAEICFNGHVTSGPWEPFHVPRIFRPRHPHQQGAGGLWFSFCKTNHQPYDMCVQGCLIVLNHRLACAVHCRTSASARWASSSDWQRITKSSAYRTISYPLPAIR